MDNLEEALKIFKGRRVLITGDTGFKGSWLALWLQTAGAEVYGYALPPRTPDDHYSVLGLEGGITHCDGDLRDLARLEQCFDRVMPEYVFHLAAQALVRPSYRDPKETFDINIGGSVNLLDCVRSCDSVRVLVYVTSDKCYLNREWVWGYRENDRLGGHDPYSASKAAAELVYSSYCSSFFANRPTFGYASVRAGNVIGGGDLAADRIVPDCFKALQSGKPIVLRNPAATRPWQHVLEPLGGYLLLAARLRKTPRQFSGSWNFGPRDSEMRSVQELANEIVAGWGSGRVEIRSVEGAPHEAGLLRLNCDKASHELQWAPRWNFQRTIKETVRWYKQVSEGVDPQAVSRAQIAEYLETER